MAGFPGMSAISLSDLFGPVWQPETVVAVAQVALLALALFAGLKICAYIIGRLVEKRFSRQSMMITRKVVTYAGSAAIVLIVLAQLGISLTGLLGAFGIAGVAIGFASQTSISNVISGLFLISEKSFELGDLIRVGDNTGVVLSIDLLSIKIRTLDNQFIRIPNETLIKSEVTTITRFPIRRMNFEFTVSYKTDLPALKQSLLEVVREIPQCLDEPEPLYVIKQFGLRGVDILLGVWFAREDFVVVKNTVHEKLLERFERDRVEVPVITVAPLL